MIRIWHVWGGSSGVDDIRFAETDTALGPMLIAATSVGIAAITRTRSAPAFLEALSRRFPSTTIAEDAAALAEPIEWLGGYLSRARHDLAAVDLRGLSEWDARVYRAIRDIPYGETASYGDVARAIGSPSAARAVGGAMSRCPLFPAVPCHRVVRAGDGFSGWGGGDIEVKRRLLDMEAGR